LDLLKGTMRDGRRNRTNNARTEPLPHTHPEIPLRLPPKSRPARERYSPGVNTPNRQGPPRIGTPRTKKYNATYVPFRGWRTSFGPSDTVTYAKSPSCKNIGSLVGSCYIDVTGKRLTEKPQLQAEIDRLVASHALHGSESLCKLLRYLGRQAAEHPGVPVKEYQIATEVFGRQTDFDPQLDSMVRV